MEKLILCRICLVEDVRMHVVADGHLQEIFEKLTNILFITEDSRPMLACFFCYARLKQCYKFQQKCLEAEAVFIQMLDEAYEQKPMQAELEFFGGFLKTSVVHLSIEDRQQEVEREDKEDIKEELTGDCEIFDDVVIKSEYHSDAVKLETNDSYPDFEDNPQKIVFQSDTEDDIQLTRMKTGVEKVKRKRRTIKKGEKSVPVAKKPKLEIRKEKLEDTIQTKDKKNEQANSKIIDRTKIRKTKSVSQIIEPIKTIYITKPGIKKSIINIKGENAAMCTNHSNNIDNDDLESNYRVNNSDDIKKHGLYHTKSKEKPHKCDICQNTFTQKRSLTSHIRIHTGEKPYKCDICQSSFTDPANLKRHIRVHTGEKPHKCEICQRSFTLKCNLLTHIRIHNGEKPYKCDICLHNFTVKKDLIRHIRIHTGEKPYKCDTCQKSFPRKCHLLSHIRIHIAEKPYQCDICQSCFTEKGTLKKHILVHTGEKPYKCDICQKSFTGHSYLKKHILVHTGEKPYKCDVCQKSFTDQSNLKRHIRIHTGERHSY